MSQKDYPHRIIKTAPGILEEQYFLYDSEGVIVVITEFSRTITPTVVSSERLPYEVDKTTWSGRDGNAYRIEQIAAAQINIDYYDSLQTLLDGPVGGSIER
jgi:hypothetical protein